MPRERTGSPVSGLVLMALVTLWSGALAVGFATAVVVGDGLSPVRRVVFVVLAGFVGVVAVRTGYELGRRLRGRSDT